MNYIYGAGTLSFMDVYVVYEFQVKKINRYLQIYKSVSASASDCCFISQSDMPGSQFIVQHDFFTCF